MIQLTPITLKEWQIIKAQFAVRLVAESFYIPNSTPLTLQQARHEVEEAGPENYGYIVVVDETESDDIPF